MTEPVTLFSCPDETAAKCMVALFLAEGYRFARFQPPSAANPFNRDGLVSRFGRKSTKIATARRAAAGAKP